jgi:acyl-CoA dehydrogenase
VDFALTTEQEELRQAARSLARKFDDRYWMELDEKHEFPWDYWKVWGESGWLGMCIPPEYGGGGLGLTEAALVLQEVTASGGALSAATTLHIGIFGLLPIVKHGSEAMKQRFLPRAAKGELHVSFAVTEPDAGTDTTRITTVATKVPGGYRVNGRKIWCSKALEAERILMITRTTPREQCVKPLDGMTLLFAEVDREHIDIRPIPKMGRNAVDSDELFIEDLFVPDEDRVGEEGRGFHCLIDALNPDRILVAMEAIGIGRVALDKVVEYAKNRVVFNRPIGMNQGVQLPLADSLAHLDAAELVALKAAWLYDRGLPCAREANTAKYLATHSAWETADRALQFHGGMGYAKEYHVERYLREVRILRFAPIANELVLAFLGEHVLGLPRSY